MNLGRELRRGRELSTSYRVSSRDGRLQSGSRDEAETRTRAEPESVRRERGTPRVRVRRVRRMVSASRERAEAERLIGIESGG